jgi:hypothetical protein
LNNPVAEFSGVGESRRGVRILAGSILAGVALASLASPSAAVETDRSHVSPTKEWRLEQSWTFDDGILPEGWSARAIVPYGDSQEYSTADNVWVYNGKLVLSVDRRCGNSPEEIVDSQNQTTAVCPKGTDTAYASGRVETGPIFSGNYRIDITLSVAEMAVAGARTAVWMKSMLPYCGRQESFIHEADILEWYSALPRLATSTSYVYCSAGEELNASRHSAQVGKDWMLRPHTVSIENVASTTTYFLDNEPVKINATTASIDTAYTFPDVRYEQYVQSVTEPTQLILNTEGFNDPKAPNVAFRAPDANKKYPVQKTMIDSVDYYVLQ